MSTIFATFQKIQESLSLSLKITSRNLTGLKRSIGILGLLYFSQYLIEFRLYTSSQGIVDHQIIRHAFWYTWLPIFSIQNSDLFWYSVIYSGLLGSLLLIIGIRTRLPALLCFLASVLLYRRNFLIMYVDDAIMHLTFFWMLLSPVEKRQGAPFSKTIATPNFLLPGIISWCMILNLSLIYFISGISKWTSPMWREGLAVGIILNSGASWGYPVSLQLLPILKIATWATLIFEPLFAFLPFYRGHFRKVMFAAAIIFHCCIIATLDVVYANIACLAILVYTFLATCKSPFSSTVSPLRQSKVSATIAVVTLLLLTVASFSSLVNGQWRSQSSIEKDGEIGDGLYKYSMGALWSIGIAQQYRLFDWIDSRNYKLKITVEFIDGDSVPLTNLVRGSTRLALLLSYISPRPWASIDQKVHQNLRAATLKRISAKVCQANLSEQSFRLTYEMLTIYPTAVSWGDVSQGTLVDVSCQQGSVSDFNIHKI